MTLRHIKQTICRGRWVIGLLFLGFLGLASGAALAQATSESIPHQPGLSHGDWGDKSYQRAIRSLSSGNYTQAQALLESITADVPQHAGAWLDLALLYCQLGETQKAELIYQRIERDLQAPLSILQVIQEMRTQGCQFELKWIKQAHVGLGYSSNVNFAPTDGVIRFAGTAPFSELILSPSYRPRSDHYVLTELQTLLPANPHNLGGAQWQGLLQYKKYQQETDQNVLALALGARWTGFFERPLKNVRSGMWPEHWETGFQFNRTHIGSSPYENSLFAWTTMWTQEQTEWLESKQAWRWGAEWNLSYYQYLQNANYDAVRIDLKWRQQWQWPTAYALHLFGLSLGPSIDKAQGDRPGGDRYGYTGLVEWDARWHPQHQTVAYIQHQSLKDQVPYSATFFGSQARLPKSTMVALRHTYRLSLEHQVYAQYLRQTTKDTINLFSYDNQSVMIGYQWLF